jgi:hypothetical protein
MKKLLFLFCAVLLTAPGYAQSNKGYTLGTTVNGVDCYYKFSQCGGNTVVLLQFNNHNKTSVNVTWKELFATTLVPENTEGFNGKQITLAPGLSAPVTCDDKERRQLLIGPADVSPTYRAEIKHFAFKNVTVTPVNKILSTY